MSTHRKSGFTIVELLVVITIITILMSLLLPAINGALRQAEKVQCLSNLRQITMAMLTYKTEWGCYPPARWYDYRAGVPGAMYLDTVGGTPVYRPLPRWQFILKEELNTPPQNPFTADRYLPPGDNYLMLTTTTSGDVPMELEAKIFKCPSLSGTPLDLDRCHYGYNYQYLGNTRHAWWNRAVPATAGGNHYGDITNQPSYANFPVSSAIKATDKTIAFADSSGDRPVGQGHCSYLIDPPMQRARGGNFYDLYAAYLDAGLVASDPDWDGDGLPDCELTTDVIYTQNSNPYGFCPIDFRHQEKASVSFCDGHAEIMSLTDSGYVYSGTAGIVANGDTDGDGIPDAGDNKYFNGTGYNPNP